MRFTAQYQVYGLLESVKKPTYWRTIDADNISEAMKVAKRYERKGYRLVLITESPMNS